MAWAAVGGAAVSVIGGLLGGKKKSKEAAPSGGAGGFAGLLSNYMTAKQGQEMASARDKAVAMADPFAQTRQLANQQLQGLMRDPSSISQDPAYQWQVQQGGQALDRSLAAKHMTASGGALQELTQWGQGLASQTYNQRLQMLANMAESGSSPTAAADAMMKGTQLSQGLMSAAGAGSLQTISGGGGGSLFDNVGTAIGGMFKGSPAEVGSLPQYSTGTSSNLTGFGTGVGGSGYDASSMGSDQAAMLASQWS